MTNNLIVVLMAQGMVSICKSMSMLRFEGIVVFPVKVGVIPLYSNDEGGALS